MSVTAKEEREAQEWVEEITGSSFEGSTFAESLKDGVILCKLANKLRAGSVAKINEPATMPFKRMENIANYLKAVRALGMKEFEMFGTPDLYDEKNVPQVISSIHALGRLVQALFPEGNFPKLGIKVVEKNERHFSEEQLREARAAVAVINLGSSDMGKKAFQDVLDGKPALREVLGDPAKTPKAASTDKPNILTSPSKGAGSMPEKSPLPPAAATVASPLAKADAKPPTPANSAATATTATAVAPTASTTAPVAVAATVAAADALPAGWTAHESEGGRIYYHNLATGTTTWEKPVDVPLPPGWEKAATAEGREYYYNASTGVTQWEKPSATAVPPLPAGWAEAKTDAGVPYYYNTEKNLTTWERPTE